MVKMKLEEIGFYTLSDERAQNASVDSRLMRCELILTDACNFKCPYCRGLREDIKGTMSFEKAVEVVHLWAEHGLKNIRLSGGEPTVWKDIITLVEYCKEQGIERIAMSTNGSASMELYRKLIEAGVNDFSISLDACCSSDGEAMSGGVVGAWEKVIENIKEISKLTYVSVGVVITEETFKDLRHIVEFADSLGVADIRIIPSAQFDAFLDNAKDVDLGLLDKHPILKYRVENIIRARHVRGIQPSDSHKCGLVLDDMLVAGKFHFPCVIYMREQGNPIGKVGPNMRKEREEWMLTHDTHKDPICKKNCLDVCIDYNNKYMEGLICRTVSASHCPN